MEACTLLQLYLPLSALIPSIKSLPRQGTGGVSASEVRWINLEPPPPRTRRNS